MKNKSVQFITVVVPNNSGYNQPMNTQSLNIFNQGFGLQINTHNNMSARWLAALMFVSLSFVFAEPVFAISKVVDCQEARSSQNEVEIALFLDEKGDYHMEVDSVADHPSQPLHLDLVVKDELAKASPSRGARTTKALFKSDMAELAVLFTEGRTPSGDEGFNGRLRIAGPQAVEADMICWFSKRALDPLMVVDMVAPEVPSLKEKISSKLNAKPGTKTKPSSKITLKPGSRKAGQR